MGDNDPRVFGIALVRNEDAAGSRIALLRDVNRHLRDRFGEGFPIQRQHELVSQETERDLFEIDRAPRLTPLRQPQGQTKDEEREQHDRTREPQQAQAGRSHRHEFLVQRQPAKGRDGGNDAGNGQSQNQERRKEVGKYV